MLESPKNPLSAALIFLVGIGIVAFTTLDVHRSMRANDVPITPEQRAAFDEFSRLLKEQRESK
jgi:hypothetical protein